jgi:hypothetical protein
MKLGAVLGLCAVFAASVSAQAPSNNSCSTPLTVFAGINPQPPNGTSGQFFTNVNATNSSTTTFGVECATNFNKDVWFEFTPTRTGNHVIKTCTPSGFTAGTLTTTTIAVYDGADCPSGGTSLACNDDSANCGTNSDRSAIGVNLWDGHTYLIRVGSESVTLAGTFYLTIEVPALAANDSCAAADALLMGANSGSFNGSNSSGFSYACSNFAVDHADVWYTYTGSLADALVGSEIALTISGAADFMAVYTGNCPSLFSSYTLVDCGTVVQFTPGLNTTYYIRVGRDFALEPSLSFTLTAVKTESPSNDVCGNGLFTFGGQQPSNTDVSAFYDNSGAVDTDFGASPPACLANSNSDVWFDYFATSSGKVLVTTDTPSGYTAGTLTNTVLAVFATCPNGDAASLIACDDNSGLGLLSSVTFDAIHGVQYKIMVAGAGDNLNTEGTFWLSIATRFRLQMSAPGGPGTFRSDLFDGAPNHLFFTCLTLNQGSFPYGPFFGIQPTFTELLLQLTSGAPPFVGFLDASGAFAWGPYPAVSGMTLYGVALEFDAGFAHVGTTSQVAFTIP